MFFVVRAFFIEKRDLKYLDKEVIIRLVQERVFSIINNQLRIMNDTCEMWHNTPLIKQNSDFIFSTSQNKNDVFLAYSKYNDLSRNVLFIDSGQARIVNKKNQILIRPLRRREEGRSFFIKENVFKIKNDEYRMRKVRFWNYFFKTFFFLLGLNKKQKRVLFLFLYKKIVHYLFDIFALSLFLNDFYLEKENKWSVFWARFQKNIRLFFRDHLARRLVTLFIIGCLLFPSFVDPVHAIFGFGHEAVVSSTEDTSEGSTIIPEVENVKVVSILVEDSLLENEALKQKIQRYAMDVQQRLRVQTVMIAIPYGTSPKEIYEGNAHLYFSGLENDQRSQLIGTVLIGDVPIPVVEKEGRIWNTIFPYTDFEDVIYQWSEDKNRFVFQGGDGEPEIWHGLIQSDVDGAEAKIAELSKYFDQNHAVHTQKEPFSKRVFFADLPLQKKGLPEDVRERYDNYIKHIEDLMYFRFNKYWANELMSEDIDNHPMPWQLVDEKALPDEIPGKVDVDVGETGIESGLEVILFIITGVVPSV